MSTFIKAAAAAIGLECLLGFGAMATCVPCGSGASHGLVGLVGFVTWLFHMPGFVLAEKLTSDNMTYWEIMWLTGLIESFGLVWLAIGIYRWKHAS